VILDGGKLICPGVDFSIISKELKSKAQENKKNINFEFFRIFLKLFTNANPFEMARKHLQAKIMLFSFI
jgi:hypothetical protein